MCYVSSSWGPVFCVIPNICEGCRSLPQIIGATGAEKNCSKAELGDLEIPRTALFR